MHAGVRQPRALLAVRRLVDHEHIADLRPPQCEGDGNTALAGADDQHIERRLAVRPDAGLEPRHAGMGDAGKVAPHFGGESGNAFMFRSRLPAAHAPASHAIARKLDLTLPAWPLAEAGRVA
jgi:hypothetical protein